MKKEELIKTVKKLLQEYDPVDLCGWFYSLYLTDRIKFTDLEFLVGICGYDMEDEFKNATDEEREEMCKEWAEDYFSEDDNNDNSNPDLTQDVNRFFELLEDESND